MPSEIMDQRRLSFFSEELLFPTERQVGFWKPDLASDHPGATRMSLLSGSRSVSSSTMGKLRPVGPSSVEGSECSQKYLLSDQNTKFGLQHNLIGGGKGSTTSMISWKANDKDLGLQSNTSMRPALLSREGNQLDVNGFHYENGLFSSSLSELLDRKLKLSSNIVSLGGQSVDIVDSNFEEEPLESLKEIEAQTIGNLLPDDDDDLLSGVIDDIGHGSQPNGGDEADDDIFCTGGGMELGDDNCINPSNLHNGCGSNDLQGGVSSPFAGEYPHGEHLSRTLFVRNINSNVEDAELRMLFEQFGDIRTLHTTSKHRGFVIISYYDIRAARNALRSLQNKPLKHWKLDIHFSIPKGNPSEKDINQGTLVVFNLDSAVSNDDLCQKLGAYGEIKEIRETPNKRHYKFIEFYDTRAAEAAFHAFNRNDISGNKIKLEHSRSGGARRCLIQQLSPDLKVEEFNGCMRRNSPSSSPPGFFDSVPFGANSSAFDNGTIPDLQSAVRTSVRPLLESALLGVSVSGPQSLSSPVGVPSGGNHTNPSGHGENGHSFGQMNFGFHGIPIADPHSLPEYHDRLTNGIQYNTISNMPAMAVNINSRPEGINHGYIQRIGSGNLTTNSFEDGQRTENSLPSVGTPGNSSLPVHRNQYIWNNANGYPHPSAGPMIWGNSPSFVQNVPSHHPQQIHGLPRAPSHMLNAVLPLHLHHVGSAPSVNRSIWERRQPYIEDSVDATTFYPRSIGCLGFSGTSPVHPLELARNIFPHSGGNCIDHVGIHSPQQRCHMFPGRNLMIPMPSSFDPPNDRIRSRRTDTNANQADNKKQYELDIERIMRGEDSRTTLMIKNIPNKYTSKMLLAAIDEHHKGTYDFIYLPIDFKNKCNVGYAFINMIDPQQIISFYQAFNGKKWEKFNSEKVASLAYARIQGKAALISHFQNSSLMNEDKRCRPILFRSDGPNAGDQEPFPVGTNIRSRPGRSRCYSNEDNNQVSPSTSPNAVGFSNGTETIGSIKDSE